MNSDVGILTNLLKAFTVVFSAGAGHLMPEAKYLLTLLVGIEITLAGIWWALRGENILVVLVQKVLTIGLFIWLVTSWPTIINWVLNGFVWTGTTAGGIAPAAGIALMNDPSQIISQSMVVMTPITTKINSLGWTSIAQIIMYGWAYILTILAFVILAVQVFVTYLEFYMVSSLSLILVPFGLFKHTSFLAEKAIGAVISFGIKLMVLAFIIAVAGPLITTINVPPDPSITNAYSVMVAALAIAFLAWNAPGIAAGMISGGPSLTAGAAAGAGAAMIGAASGAALAGQAVAKAGVSATKSAASAASGAANTVAGAAGAATTAGQLGAATAAMAGGSPTFGAIRGVASAAGGAVARGVSNKATSLYENATGGLKQAWAQGQVRGFEYTGGKATPGMKAAADQAGSGKPPPPAPPSTKSSDPSAMLLAAEAARKLRSAVPPEAHGGAGITAPIKPE